MSQRNPLLTRREGTETVTGIDTDGSGDVTVTVSELRQIDEPNDVSAKAAGGYVANVQSVNGNEVTFRIFQGGGADSELTAVTGDSGVTDLWVHALGY